MKKNYYLVLDTETCNTLEQPIPYDLGMAVCDKNGKIYEKESFVIYEVYVNMKDVLQSAYYAEKLPNYEKEIKNGSRRMVTMWTAYRRFYELVDKYNITKICAYNMGFDKRALNNLIRYVTKSKFRFWFRKDLEMCCIWNFACNTILNRPSYIEFANNNKEIFFSEKGNLYTTAEHSYKYITKNVNFLEEHTGLEDVLIEVEIMAFCFKQKKKINMKVNSACWNVPNKFYKNYQNRG